MSRTHEPRSRFPGPRHFRDPRVGAAGSPAGFFSMVAALCVASVALPSGRAADESASVPPPPEEEPLWPDDRIPGAVPESNRETSDGGNVFNVHRPSMRVFLPPADRRHGGAVVIFPGGGYGMLVAGREGSGIARWFNESGTTAIVVKYRVSSRAEDGYRHPVPLMDAQRAVRLVRHHAADWGVDPQRVGVMGFSAGGHLAATVSNLFDERTHDPIDGIDALPARPDFSILIYPVISMRDGLTHQGSRRNLLGDSPGQDLVEALSLETRVRTDTPTAFIAHGANDQAVPAGNATAYADACVRRGVPVELHLFADGPHGFTLGQPDRPNAACAPLLQRWLESIGIAGSSAKPES